MNKLHKFSITILVFFIFAANGICGESKEGGSINAIQDKTFHRYHEIDLCLGYIPDDDFYKVYPVGASYTYNYNDWLSFDFRGYTMVNEDKDIKKTLEKDFGAAPEQFSEPQNMFHGHFLFRPFYGKSAILNKGIINHESYVYAGYGIVNYKKQYSSGESSSENAQSFSFGIGTKYFINQNVTMSFEIRDMINYKDEKMENNIWFGINVGFQFNFAARKTQKDETVDNLRRYLGEEDKNE